MAKPTSSELTQTPVSLGDTVRRIDDNFHGYETCTIENIVHDEGVTTIHLVRPYIHTADFSYTGGVITYIGLEKYTVTLDEFCRSYRCLDRQVLR